MNCKHCQQELEQGVTICPHCGTDNAAEKVEEIVTEQAAPVEEKKTAAVKPGITFTPGKLALVIGAVVVLTAVVVALIMQGMGYSFSIGESGTTEPIASVDPSETVTEPAGTIPADGNPDDVTCKGSYTVSDDEVVAAMDTVVATIGENTLTSAELQIYYWLQVQDFIANYGSYAAYFGLDYTQPLDTQSCSVSETPMTWQQYFLDQALLNWKNYQALANESVAAGFELDETYRSHIDSIPESLATDAGLQGFESAEEFLAYNVGAGATIDDYVAYMERYYQGFLYFESEYAKITPTYEEIEAYFTEHEAEYAESGITKDGYYVDVRHILVLPEGATLDTIYTETFSDEAWAAGEAEAQAILDAWLAGEATEESFAALANEKSLDPGSNTNGGLYEDVYQGQMMEAFDAWCFDEARQVGDYGIVRTDAGFHVMFFSGRTTIWEAYAENDLISERANAMITAATEKYPMEVDYSAIVLGYVNMGA